MKEDGKKHVVGVPVHNPPPKQTSGDKEFDRAIDKLFPKKIQAQTK